jgi:uncharacterized protein (DUF427 family)
MDNYITLKPEEMAFLIRTLRNADIHASAARVIVTVDDKLIAEVKRVQELAEAGEIEADAPVEYSLGVDEQEMQVLASMLSNVTAKGAEARVVLELTNKFVVPVQEAQQAAAQGQMQ